MNFCSLHRYILTLCICCLALMGCSHVDDLPTPSTGSANVYLSLRINTGIDGTRANPMGGEDGDGIEGGQSNENKIDRLVMLFFDATEAPSGVDDTKTGTPIIKEFCENPILINQGDGPEWKTRPIELKNIKPGKEYYMVVIANAYHFQFDGIETLEDLQDFVFSGNHWQTGADVGDYSGFVMTSRFKNKEKMDAAKVTVSYGNTSDNPAEATAYLERLAARVDLVPKVEYVKPSSGNGYYEYPVTPTTGTSSDKIRLTGIQLINKYNQGSYLLKHLADGGTSGDIDPSTTKRIGTELTDASGKQTNYVIDPNTVYKTGDKKPLWYDNYYNDFDNWKPVVEKSVGKYFILDYTQENTMSKEMYLDRHYITSLHLECVYMIGGHSTPTTFYSYKNTKYTSLDKLVEAVKDGIISPEEVDETTVLQRPEVTTYEDGKCYYTYHIRHSGEGDAAEIMRYGIVRNNIYRITINSFKGLGSEDKNDPIPITKNVDFTISVVPWAVINNPEIIL